LSFAIVHAKFTRNPVHFLISKSIRKSAKVQLFEFPFFADGLNGKLNNALGGDEADVNNAERKRWRKTAHRKPQTPRQTHQDAPGSIGI
jgi:hypothetical protein